MEEEINKKNDAKNAKKTKLAFNFCKKCELYNQLTEFEKQKNPYYNCPITCQLNNVWEKKKNDIIDFFNVTESTVYRYKNGELNIYKKLNSLDSFKRNNIYLTLECKNTEIECPHMKVPDITKVSKASSTYFPDLSIFYAQLFDDNNLKESAINFIELVYRTSIKYSNKLDSSEIIDKIDTIIKPSKELCQQNFNNFLENIEKHIIKQYCNPNDEFKIQIFR